MNRNQKIYKIGFWMRLIGGAGFLLIIISIGPMGLVLAGASPLFGGALLSCILVFFVGHYLASNYKSRIS